LWLLKNNNLLSQEKGYLPAFEEKKEGIFVDYADLFITIL